MSKPATLGDPSSGVLMKCVSLVVAAATLLAACGGGGDSGSGNGSPGGLIVPTLTPMIINSCACKSYGDPPFTPTLPTSNSPGLITYSSRNPDVATVNATTGLITILKPGFVLIDAVQQPSGQFAAGGTTSSISIGKGTPVIQPYSVRMAWGDRPLTLPDPVSTSPGAFSYNAGYAGVVNGKILTPMVAPIMTSIYITQAETDYYTGASAVGTLEIMSNLPPGYAARAGLTWTPLTSDTLAFPQSEGLCASSSALGRTGWRLPTVQELENWDFSVPEHRDKPIWTSTPGTSAGSHMVGMLGLPRGNYRYGPAADTDRWYVLCVNTPY
jgi:hypothetical protein